jgi:hypothetical protein
MDEEKIQLEVRLIAIEHLMANLYANFYLAVGATADTIAATHAKLKNELLREAYGNDPVISDVLSDEVATAVNRLLASIEYFAAKARGRLDPQGE